jgi:hypothetical protein
MEGFAELVLKLVLGAIILQSKFNKYLLNLLCLGAALALPPPVAFAAPVVQVVAVSASGESFVGVLGGDV